MCRFISENQACTAAGNMITLSNGYTADSEKMLANHRSCLFFLLLFSAGGCMLPTCALSNLGNLLSSGDEIAGSSTSDPHGIGKK